MEWDDGGSFSLERSVALPRARPSFFLPFCSLSPVSNLQFCSFLLCISSCFAPSLPSRLPVALSLFSPFHHSSPSGVLLLSSAVCRHCRSPPHKSHTPRHPGQSGVCRLASWFLLFLSTPSHFKSHPPLRRTTQYRLPSAIACRSGWGLFLFVFCDCYLPFHSLVLFLDLFPVWSIGIPY